MILHLLLLQIVESACPKVECSSLENNVCFDRDGDDVELQTCPQGQKCEANKMNLSQLHDLSDGKKQCVPEYFTSNVKIPGELCNNDQECRSNICDQNICQGYGTGLTCSSVSDCNVGLTCSGITTGTCMALQPENGPCQSSYHCKNNCACFNGKCKKYFSLPNGSQFFVEDENTTGYLCESGYIDNSTLQCSDAPRNTLLPDQNCDSSSDCELKFPNGSKTDGRCVCGFNEYQQPFCLAVQGDDEFLQLKESMIALLQINGQCHTLASFDQRCQNIANSIQLQNFQRDYYIYLYRHMLIGASECVLNLINPLAGDYQYINSEIEANSSDQSISNDTVIIIVLITVFGVLIIIGITFFVVIKRGNWQRDEIRLDQDGAEEVLFASSRIVKSSDDAATETKFEVGNFELQENTTILQIGIPVGLVVNTSTYELIQTVDNYIAEPSTPVQLVSIENSAERLNQEQPNSPQQNIIQIF